MAANLYIYIYIFTYTCAYIYIHTSLHIYLPCKNKRLIRIYTISIYTYYLLYINKYVYIYMMCSFIHGKTMKSWIKNLLYLSNRVLLSSDHSAAWHSFGRELGSGSPAICCCVTIAVNAPESAPQVACAATLGPAVFGELSLRRYSMAFILL